MVEQFMRIGGTDGEKARGLRTNKNGFLKTIAENNVEIGRAMEVIVQPNSYLVVVDKVPVITNEYYYAIRTEQGASYKTQIQWYAHAEDNDAGSAIAISSLTDLDSDNTPFYNSDRRLTKGRSMFLRLQNLSSFPRTYSVFVWGCN